MESWIIGLPTVRDSSSGITIPISIATLVLPQEQLGVATIQVLSCEPLVGGVFFGEWNPTQFCGDYFINHEMRILNHQDSNWKVRDPVFVFFSHGSCFIHHGWHQTFKPLPLRLQLPSTPGLLLTKASSTSDLTMLPEEVRPGMMLVFANISVAACNVSLQSLLWLHLHLKLKAIFFMQFCACLKTISKDPVKKKHLTSTKKTRTVIRSPKWTFFSPSHGPQGRWQFPGISTKLPTFFSMFPRLFGFVDDFVGWFFSDGPRPRVVWSSPFFSSLFNGVSWFP